MKTTSTPPGLFFRELASSRLFLLALLVFPALRMRAEISFRGIVVTENAAKFSLYSSEDQTSKWVSVGEDFAGHRVAAFDASHEMLTLTVGPHRLALRMGLVKNIASQAVDGFSLTKTRYVFAGGRFQALFGSGVDAAYELVKTGDVLLGNLLVQYETALASYNELAALAPVAHEHLAILAQRATSVRSMVERAVNEKTQSANNPHPPIR